MKKSVKISLIVIALVSIFAIPTYAVFKEKNILRTLEVLKFELRDEYEKKVAQNKEGDSRREVAQHRELIKLIENCNELSIMLYSQQQDYTFDLTYALNKVTDQYLHFNASRMPYNDIVERLEIEIDRYDKMAITLQNLPPVAKQQTPVVEEEPVAEDDSLGVEDTSFVAVPSILEEAEAKPFMLDSRGQELRDSCLYYAQAIEDLYWEDLFNVDEDNNYYTETDRHIKDAYNYAQERYKNVQKKIFVDGQTNYFTLLKNIKMQWRQAINSCVEKYSTTSHKEEIVSEWRGPMVVGFAAIVFFYIILSFVLSNVIVRILLAKVKVLQKPYFQDHKTTFLLLFGVVLFALSIMIVSMVAKENNFIRMAAPLLAEAAWLMAAIFLSILIRLRKDQSNRALAGYTPVIVMALVIICLRIIFVPNSMLNILLPPVLLFFCIWQFLVNRKAFGVVPNSDKVYMWVSFLVIFIATIAAWSGYVMMALLFVIWWMFQLTVLQSIAAVYFLLSNYYDHTLVERQAKYRRNNPNIPLKHKGAFIEISWGYDLLKMTIVPTAILWSIPLCIYMAGSVFDLSKACLDLFNDPLVNIEKLQHISLSRIVTIITLYYVFRYLIYAFKAFYRLWKTKAELRKMDEGVVFKDTNVNFTLSDNISTLLGWGLYVIISFVMLKIPTSAITIVSTGLATGVGFALKDVLNNFFYGIQLMSGRLRVGDIIECDGIRGSVDSMSYQSTQILSIDGAIIAIPNSTLFSKNFKNLTRNHAYELLQIPVGVKYGTDIEKVRQIITEALKKLQVKDKYGRDVVDSKNGVIVKFHGFGDNSVDLIVQQYTTVDAHYTYEAKAKEIIYNALNENGIEIPFPQRDLYIKTMPEEETDKQK